LGRGIAALKIGCEKENNNKLGEERAGTEYRLTPSQRLIEITKRKKNRFGMRSKTEVSYLVL
jgi:hypothetical protein